MRDDLILPQDRGAVRILSMNRPDKLNALDTALTRALLDALEAADAHEAVRAIVLTGEGRSHVVAGEEHARKAAEAGVDGLVVVGGEARRLPAAS